MSADKAKVYERRIEHAEALLSIEPMTRAQLAAAMCLSEKSVSAYLTKLHKQQMIYIAGWQRPHGVNGQNWLAQYRAGWHDDVPRPTPAQPKKEPLSEEQLEAQERLRELAKLRAKAARFELKRDPLVEALFGPAKVAQAA